MAMTNEAVFRRGDKVHVPGRFRFLIVDSVSEYRIVARFESGFGHVELPPHAFAAGSTEGSDVKAGA